MRHDNTNRPELGQTYAAATALRRLLWQLKETGAEEVLEVSKKNGLHFHLVTPARLSVLQEQASLRDLMTAPGEPSPEIPELPTFHDERGEIIAYLLPPAYSDDLLAAESDGIIHAAPLTHLTGALEANAAGKPRRAIDPRPL